MTSPLPRKPLITRPTARTTTNSTAIPAPAGKVWPVLGGLAAWLLAAIVPCLAAQPAIADQHQVRPANYASDDDSTKVVQVGYSVGKSGHKLKWLPSGPAAGKTATRHAQYTAGSARHTAQRAVVDPFDDPFGDTFRLSQTGQQPGSLSDQLLRVPTPAPVAPPEQTAPRLMPELATPRPSPEEPKKLAEPVLQGESAEKPETVAPKRDELEDLIATGPGFDEDECMTPSEVLRPIGELTDDISVRVDKGRPKSDQVFPSMCDLGGEFQPRVWAPSTFTWKASGLCHKPAYFDDPHLERYGHSCGPYLQTLASGAHFFLTIPVLPYKMGLYPPGECVYTLGYYRPGSCAPYMLDPLPLSIRAGLAEAGVWTGLPLLIP